MINRILFVWDFHGTLEKDNVRALEYLVNKTLWSFGIKKEITFDETVRLYGLSWIDYFKYMYPDGNLGTWRKMKSKAVEIQTKEQMVERYIKPMDFAQEVLGTIKQKEHSNIVLSNTAPEHIEYFASLVGINNFIDDYLALDTHDTLRQKTEIQEVKSTILQNYVKDKQFGKIIKIGDRESDIEAGKTVGAVTYFFRNEFNKNHQLAIKPDYEISDLRRILKEL